MKKALLLAAVVLLAAFHKEQGQKLVTLALSGMTIEQEAMKSTTTEAGMTDLWVYDNGTLARHLTVLTGEVYGRTSGMTITLDDAWEDDGMAF